MLGKLSLRNAKRQAKEYVLYFFTLVIAAAMLYSFNSFIFSETFTQLTTLLSENDSNSSIITVVFYSVLIVFVVSWLVSYMMNYMLQKRSREFATYMLLGIEKREIGVLYFRENILIGSVSLIFGLLVGCVVSALLQVIFGSAYGGNFSIYGGLSIRAAALTCLYFAVIFFLSLLGSRRKLNRMRLISLLYYERHNEVPYVKNAVLGRVLLIGFVLTGIESGLIFYFQPFGNYCDMLLGFGMMVISCFSFFIGGMAVLYHRLVVNRKWAYQGNHLFIYRNFISQARKSALSFGAIAAVFAIGMVLISTGASYHKAVDELTNQESFDLMILHMNEEFDFSEYAEYLENTEDVESSYTYNLYTTRKQDYIELRNEALSDYFVRRKLEATPKEYLYTENRFDTYMKYSDYCRLREMLGLEQVEMGESQYLVHCMPYLQEPLTQVLRQSGELNLSGSVLTYAGIHTEKFSLYDGYGNGQELLIVVPDECVSDMDVLYGLYAANLGEDVDLKYLKAFCDKFDTLEMMDVNYVDGTVSDTESYMTRLPSYSKDYLHGRYVLFAERIEVMLILSLIYLGIVLFIAGTVIFSVRLLSELREQMRYYRMLGILGMDRRQIVRTLRKQILLNFTFSLIAYLPLSIGVVYITSSMIINQYFLVPVFDSVLAPIAGILGISVGVFLLIYCIYGIMVFYITKKEILKMVV